jgi:hypothetical protein
MQSATQEAINVAWTSTETRQMKYEIGTFKRSNWMTFVLLTVVMVGFGIFAEAHTAAANTGELFTGELFTGELFTGEQVTDEQGMASSQSVITPTAGNSTLNEFLRDFF